MQSLAWYVARLRRTSPREVTHRIFQLARSTVEQYTGGLTARVVSPARVRELPSGLLLDHPITVDQAQYIEAAGRILEGRFDIFSMSDCNLGMPPAWNRDPLTGVTAPLVFGKSIDYRDERIVGNIKYLWEPSRHLELVTLAQAYALTQDQKWLRGVTDLMRSWMRQCPYPRGVHWTSSLELAIRLINWSLVWRMTGGLNSPMFAEDDGCEFRDEWLACIYRHMHFIRNYYSRYSSANNHRIGESAGVFVAARTWDYWPESAAWAREAFGILLEESERQVYDDGGSKEQSTAYLQFVYDFFLHAFLAAHGSGYGTAELLAHRMQKMASFLSSIMDVGGNVPMIGDEDDGFVTRLSIDPEDCPYRSMLAVNAVLFDTPALPGTPVVPDERTLWLLGDKRCRKLATIKHQHVLPQNNCHQFPDSGYFVLGDKLGTAEECRLIVDCGPLGFLSLAAHGHADALAVWLSVAGREILIDPGTYSYHTEKKWRDYFRGTRAHNTVCVDDLDQSVAGGNFLWSRHAHATLHRFESNGATIFFEGEHDGYSRLRNPVSHRRQITLTAAAGEIEICDLIQCQFEHKIERIWHFSENCDVNVSHGHIDANNDGVRVKLIAEVEPESVIVNRGSEDPPSGWVSRRFGRKCSTTTVHWVDRVSETTNFITRIQYRNSRSGSDDKMVTRSGGG